MPEDFPEPLRKDNPEKPKDKEPKKPEPEPKPDAPMDESE